MVGIGHQRMTIKMFGKNPFADRYRLLLAQLTKAERLPGGLTALDNKGRRIVIKLIRMGPHPAMLGVLENKREGVVERLMRTQPNKLTCPHINVGFEVLGIGLAGAGVKAVGGQYQIILTPILINIGIADISFETHFNTQFASALL